MSTEQERIQEILGTLKKEGRRINLITTNPINSKKDSTRLELKPIKDY